jgi:hypothetical protein
VALEQVINKVVFMDIMPVTQGMVYLSEFPNLVEKDLFQ